MAEAERDPGLHRKLVWLTLFRIATVTVLLGGTGAVGWEARGDADAVLAPLYGVVIASYAASIAFLFALRHRRWLIQTAFAEIALDATIAAVLVAVTGRDESVFIFMFSLGIVNGAVLLFRRGALTAGGLSVVAYLAIAVGHAPPRTLFVHSVAFVAIAVLASYLSEQLRVTGERLAARESDLAAITALHEAIVQSMTSGVMTLDADGAVSYLNPVAEQITGVPLSRARGLPASNLLPAFDPTAARDELELENAAGQRLRVGYSSFPLRGRGGQRFGTAVIFQDLTRLRAMEEAVQRAERLADLGGVAAGLAHELRNPLASMSGAIELLRSQTTEGADDRRLMEIVLREADRLNRLVGEFLRFARPAQPRRERVDVAAVAEETLRVFAHDPAAAVVTIERDLPPTMAECDPGQIRQVLWNLLINAAQALVPGAGTGGMGRIRVECALEQDGAVVFAVEDDGPGIPRAERERVFLPFHTTKEGGTGLGLATVHRIVDAHGGRVTISAPVRGGTRFTVRLPPPLAAAG